MRSRRISTQRRPIIGSSSIPARCTRSRTPKPPSSARSSTYRSDTTPKWIRKRRPRRPSSLPLIFKNRQSLVSRNSRSARSASASSKGRSCRHCSDRRKSQADRNSASRHRTRNNLGLDRYTKGAGRGAPCAKPKLSGSKLEDCYSVADDSPAGSRSRASVAPAVYEPAQPARR